MAEQLDIKLYKRNNTFFVIISKEDSLQSVIDNYNLGELTENNLLELKYNDIDNSDNLLTMISNFVPIKTGKYKLTPGYKNKIKSNEELLRNLIDYINTKPNEFQDEFKSFTDITNVKSIYYDFSVKDYLNHAIHEFKVSVPINLVKGYNLFIGNSTIAGIDNIFNGGTIISPPDNFDIKIEFLNSLEIKTILNYGKYYSTQFDTSEYTDFNYFLIDLPDYPLNLLWKLNEIQFNSISKEDLDNIQIPSLYDNRNKSSDINYIKKYNISDFTRNIYEEKKEFTEFTNWLSEYLIELINSDLDERLFLEDYLKKNKDKLYIFTYLRVLFLYQDISRIKEYFVENCIKILKSFDYIDFYQKLGNVLIHCNAGESRSGAILVGYLMKKKKLNFTKALISAKKSRFIIRPSNWYILILLFLEEQNWNYNFEFSIDIIKEIIDKKKEIIFYDYNIQFVKDNIKMDEAKKILARLNNHNIVEIHKLITF